MPEDHICTVNAMVCYEGRCFLCCLGQIRNIIFFMHLEEIAPECCYEDANAKEVTT
jgi:hypothetical protein